MLNMTAVTSNRNECSIALLLKICYSNKCTIL